MAWQSLGGVADAQGGNGAGMVNGVSAGHGPADGGGQPPQSPPVGQQQQQQQQQANHVPLGTEYTLQGVMRFLQTEWQRHERDRNAWEIERQEMKGRIARLEGATRKSEAKNTSLERYVAMLETAVKDREARLKALRSGGKDQTADKDPVKAAPKENIAADELEVKHPGNTAAPRPRGTFLHLSPKAHELGSLDSPADPSDDLEDPERSNMKTYLEKSQGELSYLLVAPANPLPPHVYTGGDGAVPYTAAYGQPSQDHIYDKQQQQQQQQLHQQQEYHAANMVRSMADQNHQGPASGSHLTNLPIRSADVNSSTERRNSPPRDSDWPSAMNSDQGGEEHVTKINHAFDAYGRPIDLDAANDLGRPADSDGWDFNEAAAFPEPESRPSTQRPDTDMFPVAQELPKSPARGTGAQHSRKRSMSRRKSADPELSLHHQANKLDHGSYKVRFGLRGHLNVVRAVIFTGGGSPGEPELCTSSDDGTIKRWIISARQEGQGHALGQNTTGANDVDVQPYFTHRGHHGSVMCLASWSPMHNFAGGRAQGEGWVFSGGQDATIRVWERGRVDPKATLEGHTDAVWAVCVLPGTSGSFFGAHNPFGGPDRIVLVSGAADGTVKVWSVSAPPSLVSPSGGSQRRGGRVRGNSMSSGSGYPGTAQPSLASNTPCTYTLVHNITRPDSTASPTSITALTPSGDAFVVAYADAACLVYDTRTGDVVASMASLETYDGTMRTAVNAVVATTSGLDGALSFDASRTAQEDDSTIVGGATGGQNGLEGIIITGHEDRFIRFYDANSGQCTYGMLAHPAAISSLALSPDGRELVSAGHDASLRFWSLEKRACTQEITSHRLMRGEGVCCVVWSLDGRWVVSAGGDGVVKVFAR